jgi:hypothetical protein
MLVLALMGSCATSNSHRRSLLIDDLDAYAARGEVTKTVLGNGWCMASSHDAQDVYERCPRDSNLWLALSFKGERLVTAMLFVPLPARTPPRAARAGGGLTRVQVAPDPFHGKPEQVLVIDRPLGNAGAAAPSTSVRQEVLEALADEWRARYGAPFRHGATWYEWRPRPGLRGIVAETGGGVVEIYVFDPDVILDGELVAGR